MDTHKMKQCRKIASKKVGKSTKSKSKQNNWSYSKSVGLGFTSVKNKKQVETSFENSLGTPNQFGHTNKTKQKNPNLADFARLAWRRSFFAYALEIISDTWTVFQGWYEVTNNQTPITEENSNTITNHSDEYERTL